MEWHHDVIGLERSPWITDRGGRSVGGHVLALSRRGGAVGVHPALGHQLVVGADLDDAAEVLDDDRPDISRYPASMCSTM
jgi:hypothetical protein